MELQMSLHLQLINIAMVHSTSYQHKFPSFYYFIVYIQMQQLAAEGNAENKYVQSHPVRVTQ